MTAVTAIPRTHFPGLEVPSLETPPNSVSAASRKPAQPHLDSDTPSRPPRRQSKPSLPNISSAALAAHQGQGTSSQPMVNVGDRSKAGAQLADHTASHDTLRDTHRESANIRSKNRAVNATRPAEKVATRRTAAALGAADGTLRNLAQASLSTPELHLASDPLVDIADPEHRLLITRIARQKKTQAFTDPSASALHTKRSSRRSNLQVSIVDQARPAGASMIPSRGSEAFSSLGAVLGSAGTEYGRGTDDGPQQRARKDSAGTTIIRDHFEEPPHNPRTSETSSASGNWFQRRTRKWSASARAGKVPALETRTPMVSTIGDSDTVPRPSLTLATPRQSVSSSLCDSGSDLSTGHDNASTFFSDSGMASSMSQMTAATEASLSPVNPNAVFLDRLRSARTYLTEELQKLTPMEMGADKERVENLTWISREQEQSGRTSSLDYHKEMLDFWRCISSGVLLCLLANRLMPNAINRIDRRDVDWVKSDNISRFLRALRDYFNIRTKDLFHPLDLADATVEGLDRAVHTILAVQKAAKNSGMSVRSPSSPVTSAIVERVQSKRRSLIASPPQSPEYAALDLPTGESVEDFSWSPAGSPSKHSNSFGSRRDQAMTVQQHRQAAEAKLSRNMMSSSLLTQDTHARARRRRSSDHSGQPVTNTRSKGPSISFAEGSFLSRSSLDEDNSALASASVSAGSSYGRLPYRDRKMSESAVSLTGVAEEDHEDALAGGDASPNGTRTEAMEIVQAKFDLNKHSQAPASQPLRVAGHSNNGDSYRRGSQEVVLSSSPRTLRGPFDALALGDEFRTTTLSAAGSLASASSPLRQTPIRRHSARAGSSLNPARESPSSGNSPGPEPSLIFARVPFPRSQSSTESPTARRLSANLGAAATDAAATPSPALRPAYRHLRYTSELHLPSVGGSSVRADDGASFCIPTTPSSSSQGDMLATPRPRFDSEVGSLYSSSATNLLSQEDLTTPSARVAREPSINPTSRHKLVLTTGGKSVTFQMGNCIGRGQFGSVYRALNLNSGQMVAVKRIKLEGRSEEEVTQLMNEVDLLKSLEHPSVVKYEGLVRGPDVVSIILEYVENGSLLHTLKAFGNFPEKLVASYVVKILEGLDYLHEKDVVHCDLKAANILTTKNGNVKLSDFGVSLNLKAIEKVQANDAIGTPNWMAPEVIELKGASTAADIWSLGCTIIELLTGKPPYGDMLAMSALFRIVEDDRPPIPDKCSDTLHDFLTRCFAKDPKQRPTAAQLFEHDWLREMWTGHKELRAQDSVPFLRRISLDRRRVDIKTLQAAINEIAESPAEQPTAATQPRPNFDNLRSFSTPAGDRWSASFSVDDEANSQLRNAQSPAITASFTQSSDATTPTAIEAGQQPLAPSDSALVFPTTWKDERRSPGTEESKPHSFVKSTFSKAVRCRICADSVRKHAVLCEECGLICHASCARDVAASCNVRAQMTLLRQQDNALYRGASPTASVSSANAGGLAAVPTSAGSAATTLLPLAFKFPFSRGRRLSKSGEDALAAEGAAGQVSVAVTPNDEKPPLLQPLPSATEKEATRPTARRRRISLLPMNVLRARSPSPKPSKGLREGEVVQPASGVLPGFSVLRGGLKDARRASSISYGSMSASSSVSSSSQVGGALDVGKSQTPLSGTYASRVLEVKHAMKRRDHRPSHSLAAVSTPHLSACVTDAPKKKGGRTSHEAFRRASVQGATRKFADALNAGSSKEADGVGSASLGAGTAPPSSWDARRSRRTSLGPSKSKSRDKEDCSIM
ncbi:unnamed protein product [Parajaminaea phylloscopi]